MSFRAAYHALGRRSSGPLPLIRDGSPSSFGKPAKKQSFEEWWAKHDKEEREREAFWAKQRSKT